MWLFAKHGFLSIVQHRNQPSVLMVRARVADDIRYYFPQAQVLVNDAADYRYCANIRRGDVVARIAAITAAIDYDKFKPAIDDHDRRAPYYPSVAAIMDDSQQDSTSHRVGARPGHPINGRPANTERRGHLRAGDCANIHSGEEDRLWRRPGNSRQFWYRM